MTNGVNIYRNFAAKSAEQITQDLLGFPAPCVEAALRFHEAGWSDEVLDMMLPGMIEFHLPRGAARPPEGLADTMSLRDDLGLDSLSLAEMAFKLEELFEIRVESSDVAKVKTVGDLKAFLKNRLAAE
jgi:acyl carrier protein